MNIELVLEKAHAWLDRIRERSQGHSVFLQREEFEAFLEGVIPIIAEELDFQREKALNTACFTGGTSQGAPIAGAGRSSQCSVPGCVLSWNHSGEHRGLLSKQEAIDYKFYEQAGSLINDDAWDKEDAEREIYRAAVRIYSAALQRNIELSIGDCVNRARDMHEKVRSSATNHQGR